MTKKRAIIFVKEEGLHQRCQPIEKKHYVYVPNRKEQKVKNNNAKNNDCLLFDDYDSDTLTCEICVNLLYVKAV